MLKRTLLMALAASTTLAFAASAHAAYLSVGTTNTYTASTTLTGSIAAPALTVKNGYGTSANAFGLYGLLTAKAPTASAAAVRGSNGSTNGFGYGVWGSQAGAGTGVYGTAASGIGVYGRHLASTGTGPGVEGQSAALGGAGVLGSNSAGGPGLQSIVSSNSVAPLKVNSTAVVPNLHAANSDALGGHASSYFLPTTGTAANASKLGGNVPSYYLPAAGTAANSNQLGGKPAATFYRTRATPQGNAVTTLDNSATVGQYASATIGSDGLPLVTYYSAAGGAQGVWIAHCSDPACTSATHERVSSSGDDFGPFTSVAIGADGLPLISFYDVTNEALDVLHCDKLDCSTYGTRTTLDTINPGQAGVYTSIAIGADGLGLISYGAVNGVVFLLKVAHCSNAACTSATKAILASPGGAYTSTTIGSDGLGLISYQNTDFGNLMTAHCNDVSCATASTSTIATGNVGNYTSITTGSDGLGLISHYDETIGKLRVAHCSDIACSTATDIGLGVVGNQGQHTSITVGADGLPLVSFYDVTDHTLLIRRCLDLSCSLSTPLILDDAGDVGQYSSITIGTDGKPLVSYYDATNGHLKVMHCGSATCVPYFRRR